MSNTKTAVWSSGQMRGTYYSDGITRVTDPFWINICRRCGKVFMSCECTCRCPVCGSSDAERRMGGIPYSQVVAERGSPNGCGCQSGLTEIRDNQSLSE